jgi:hypothetical protein
MTTSTFAHPSSTTSAPPPPFPSVVVQAMAQFSPLPSGAEAPIRLPQFSGFATAQTGGLGGQDNVTLIATPAPVPINSAQLNSSGGTEIAAFSTTPTASVSNAQSALTQAKSQSIEACGGPSQPETLGGGTQATTCPTLDGAAIDWSYQGWQVQVLTLNGTNPSVDEANQVASALSASGVPGGDGGGILSVQVPGSSSAGTSDTAALEWTVGPDVYQVRSSDSPVDAVQVAAAMRPFPNG